MLYLLRAFITNKWHSTVFKKFCNLICQVLLKQNYWKCETWKVLLLLGHKSIYKAFLTVLFYSTLKIIWFNWMVLPHYFKFYFIKFFSNKLLYVIVMGIMCCIGKPVYLHKLPLNLSYNRFDQFSVSAAPLCTMPVN